MLGLIPEFRISPDLSLVWVSLNGVFYSMTVGGSEYNGGDFQGTVLRRILKLSLGSVREWLMSSLGPNITGPCPSFLLWICTFLVLRHLICFFLFPFSLFLKVQSTEWIVHWGRVRLESLWAWFWFKGVLPWGKRSEGGLRRPLQPNSALTGRYHQDTSIHVWVSWHPTVGWRGGQDGGNPWAQGAWGLCSTCTVSKWQ